MPMVNRTESLMGMLLIVALLLGIAWIAWVVIKGMGEDE